MHTLKSKASAARPSNGRPLLHPLSHAVISALCCFYAGQALALDAGALPTNGQVTGGSGSISQSGNVMTVTQTSDRMIAKFDTYNVGSGAQVNYLQPSSSSVAMNLVTSSDASQIMGQINANGQVYLINPSGILFGQGAAINVGGLVASALPISDANFMAGNASFDASGTTATGTVINKGTITAADGGYVALLGAQVRNEGVVVAKLGRIMLGAGEKVTLDFNGDGLINMEVNDAAAGAAATNSGLLQANGGTVIMSARSSDALLSNVVNNEGVIEATSLQNRNGTVLLDGGDAGIVATSGTIDVSGRNAGETGGTVKALGQYVGVFDGARIDASGDAGGGTVLIGGNYQGSGTEHQADSTFMEANASIRADAINSGDGGKVVLWSTGSTGFYGDISVLGGGQTGAGGVVETSGHDLDAWGSVNLSAASGRGGSWLIDPYNINITSAASSGTTGTGDSATPFTPAGSANSTLSSATLNSSLSEGANVVVKTLSGGSTAAGDINVQDNIQGVGNASLTLQADRSIIMSGKTISSGAGKTLNVSLFSNFGNTGNGSVSLANSTITTNGGAFKIGGGSDPTTGAASTQGGTFGVFISNTTISAAGGDITIRGAVASGSGDAVIVNSSSSITTSGSGSITVEGNNLGTGNGTRIFSSSNTIAATGTGDVTITGNAASGFGVLICSTSATTVQNISTGSGTLTIQGSAAGRAVYLAAGAAGAINLNSTAGGNIVVNGASTGSYGVILNATGAGAVIGIATSGDITVTGSTSGGSTPALGLSSSGAGASPATASRINIASSGSGNVLIKANNNVVSASGLFRGLFLDASAAFASINIGTQAGSLTLDGSSLSGRGVDIAPSVATAAVNISTASGPILISGNSTGSYGILFNSTGASTVASTSGDITLNGTTAGSGEAISVIGNGSAATNTIATGASGNMNISAVGGSGYGLRFNGGTNNLTVVDGVLFIKARVNGGTALGQSADITTIAATGSGSVIKNFGGQLSNVLTDPAITPTMTSVQSAMTGGDWMAPIADGVTNAANGAGVINSATFATSPLNDGAGRVTVSVQSDNPNNPNNPGTGKQDDLF